MGEFEVGDCPNGDDSMWLVRLPDGGVRSMTLDELDRAFQSDLIGADTPVMADGANVWKTLGELLGDDQPAHAGSQAPSHVSATHPIGQAESASLPSHPAQGPVANPRTSSPVIETYLQFYGQFQTQAPTLPGWPSGPASGTLAVPDPSTAVGAGGSAPGNAAGYVPYHPPSTRLSPAVEAYMQFYGQAPMPVSAPPVQPSPPAIPVPPQAPGPIEPVVPDPVLDLAIPVVPDPEVAVESAAVAEAARPSVESAAVAEAARPSVEPAAVAEPARPSVEPTAVAELAAMAEPARPPAEPAVAGEPARSPEPVVPQTTPPIASEILDVDSELDASALARKKPRRVLYGMGAVLALAGAGLIVSRRPSPHPISNPVTPEKTAPALAPAAIAPAAPPVLVPASANAAPQPVLDGHVADEAKAPRFETDSKPEKPEKGTKHKKVKGKRQTER